jgi:hypothetical protein
VTDETHDELDCHDFKKSFPLIYEKNKLSYIVSFNGFETVTIGLVICQKILGVCVNRIKRQIILKILKRSFSMDLSLESCFHTGVLFTLSRSSIDLIIIMLSAHEQIRKNDNTIERKYDEQNSLIGLMSSHLINLFYNNLPHESTR